MTRARPPWLATSLLKRFAPRNEALAGDLREAYLAGKSTWWYWRQALWVLATANHRLMMARGVVVGWVTLLAFDAVMLPVSRDVMGTRVLDWLILHLGSHPFVMLYAVVLWFLPVEGLGYIVSGWVVGWSHRPCRSMAVFVFMTTVLVRSAWWWATWWKSALRLDAPVAYPSLRIASAALPLLILAGGALAEVRAAQAGPVTGAPMRHGRR